MAERGFMLPRARYAAPWPPLRGLPTRHRMDRTSRTATRSCSDQVLTRIPTIRESDLPDDAAIPIGAVSGDLYRSAHNHLVCDHVACEPPGWFFSGQRIPNTVALTMWPSVSTVTVSPSTTRTTGPVKGSAANATNDEPKKGQLEQSLKSNQSRTLPPGYLAPLSRISALPSRDCEER
jgi:hypothetical protein